MAATYGGHGDLRWQLDYMADTGICLGRGGGVYGGHGDLPWRVGVYGRKVRCQREFCACTGGRFCSVAGKARNR